jgi:hypothetical protein
MINICIPRSFQITFTLGGAMYGYDNYRIKRIEAFKFIIDLRPVSQLEELIPIKELV